MTVRLIHLAGPIAVRDQPNGPLHSSGCRWGLLWPNGATWHATKADALAEVKRQPWYLDVTVEQVVR